MGITLYEHNRVAYESALAMLSETGKAAVIHPTGTGKSFIGFKLCEDNPDKTVLWLSPSEYIFQTQLQNLKATGGEEPENAVFITYAKLMNMGDEALGEIKPDFMILDEFHRAGAEQWGAGVKRLIGLYPDVPLLGLSATNIRYLDNRRDMAEELFDGNIASEMTLGEAIVRGILNPPKYVLSVYSYQKDLERYERRVKTARQKAVRDAAEKYLEALRRALDKADGLDAVFDRNMTDRTGKYIVFCANKEQMDEMMKQSLSWFSRVDKAPRVYSVYAEDPLADRAFCDFKADTDASHLRLLYCINALNEGIHVEDISGVILLRPTVSPIIYKQQIGRALSAGKAKEPVIFDIVNNIAGLYSIDAIEQEMQDVIRYYRYLGEEGFVVNERFRLIDEVRDCRRLFDELETALLASWDLMYAEAARYYKTHGDLLPPQSYITESGCRLGQWIVTQRLNYRACAGRGGRGLTSARIEKLEKIGMRWQTLRERQWDEGYALAQAYHAQYGDLRPRSGMGGKLRHWLENQRSKQREGLLSDGQFKMLDKIGMVWEFEDVWERRFAAAKAYYEANGNLDIPVSYLTGEGQPLGAWYRDMRDRYEAGTLPLERQKMLESIGADWESVQQRNWMRYYDRAKRYYEEHGDLDLPVAYVTPDGVNLGSWLSGQRYRFQKGRLSEERIRLLSEIGMSWQRFAGKWDAAYEFAAAYYREHGDLDIPFAYKTQDGLALGVWLANQRGKFAAGKLKPGQIKRLNALHIVWEPANSAWQCGFDHAEAYYGAHGDLNVPSGYRSEDGYKLGSWISNQRTRRKNGRMTDEQQKRLETIGMQWDRQSSRWQTGYEHAREYFVRHGGLDVPSKYVCEDGYTLSNWLIAQQKAYRDGKLPGERKAKLDEIGMDRLFASKQKNTA